MKHMISIRLRTRMSISSVENNKLRTLKEKLRGNNNM